MTMPLPAVAPQADVTAADPIWRRYLGKARAADFIEPRNLVCMTLYNEPVGEFTATLAALLVGLREAECAGRDDDGASAVFIVADGADRIAPAVRALLIQLNMLPAEHGVDAGTVFHHSLHAPSAVLAALAGAALDYLPLERPVRIIACIKPENRGKLDSHALFFGRLCRTLNPVYCHQLDVGTMIAPDAVRAFGERMDVSPAVAALASQVCPPMPAADDGLLRNWQYLDFQTQLALGWPGEVTSGHLSVLPGQYCIIRWSALRGADDGSAPLDRYLRGAGAVAGLERMMFLAEDRVIGNELVLAADACWTLDYCRAAQATTDACATLPELLRQRRRWNNGSAACRLWLIGQWRGQLRRPDRTPRDKLRFSAAMLWQAMTMAQQLLVPALIFSSWAVLAAALMRCGPVLAAATALAAAGSWALILRPARRGTDALARDAACVAYFVLVSWALAAAFGLGTMALLMAPSITAAAMTAFASGTRHRTTLRRSAEFWVVNPVMQVLLVGYALLHLDDLSWGTKGLTAAGDAARERRAMTRLRNLSFGGWLIVNGVAVWIGLAVPGMIFAPLGPVLEASSLLALLVTLPASLTFFARARPARRRSASRPAQAMRLVECGA